MYEYGSVNYIEITEGEFKSARGYILLNQSNTHSIKCRAFKDGIEKELYLKLNQYKTIEPRTLEEIKR